MEEKFQDKNLYELGYLLVPTINADKIPEEVSVLRNALESFDGVIQSEEQPKMKKLSYEVSQDLAGGKRNKYEDAYFGWMRFDLSSEGIIKFGEELKKNDSILRHLIINLSKEGTNALKIGKPRSIPLKRVPKTASDKEEIDKEIDNLLAKNDGAAE
jgi:ribosomal protein S6